MYARAARACVCVCVLGQRDFGFFRFGDPAISSRVIARRKETTVYGGDCSRGSGGLEKKNIRMAGGQVVSYVCVCMYIHICECVCIQTRACVSPTLYHAPSSV